MLALVAARGVLLCYAVLQFVNFSLLILCSYFVGLALSGVSITVVCKEVVVECCGRSCRECACRVCRHGCSSVVYAVVVSVASRGGYSVRGVCLLSPRV